MKTNAYAQFLHTKWKIKDKYWFLLFVLNEIKILLSKEQIHQNQWVMFFINIVVDFYDEKSPFIFIKNWKKTIPWASVVLEDGAVPLEDPKPEVPVFKCYSSKT